MKKITTIWIILLTLTLFSFLVGELKITNNFFIALLLVTTFFKGQLIINYFMNLSEVQLKYKLLPIIWLASVLIIIAFTYYLPDL